MSNNVRFDWMRCSGGSSTGDGFPCFSLRTTLNVRPVEPPWFNLCICFGNTCPVLYRFLEYFSQFDWESYCISLKGSVCKSSLPDIVGNFYRIRSAFKYGAHKLGHVLSQPADKVTGEIREFFANAIVRHGNDNRNNIQHLALEFGDEESLTASLSSPVELFYEDNTLIKSSATDVYNDGVEWELGDERELSLERGSEGYNSGEQVVSGQHIVVDAYDQDTSNSSPMNGSPDYESNSNYSTSLSWNNSHKSFFFSSKLSAEIGCLEAGNSLQNYLLDTASQKYGMKSCLENTKEHKENNSMYKWCMDNVQAVPVAGSGFVCKDNMSHEFKDLDLTSTGGESEAFNPLADLSGDYDSHVRSLLYGQLCHGFSLSASVGHHPVSSRIKNKKPWDIVCQSMPFWQSRFSQMSFQSKKMSMGQSMRLAADFSSPGNAFGSEGAQKARGTGTFFPHVNGSYKERPSEGRSKNNIGSHDQLHKYGPSNGSNLLSGPKNNPENGNHEVMPTKSRSQGRERLDVQCQSPRSVGKGNQKNGDLRGSIRIEFGSIGNLAESADSMMGSTTVAMKQERVEEESIHLKNEVEFPPLCL